MKECRRCHKMKPLEDFHRRYGSKDGRNSYCKECANEAVREWRRNNPDKARKHAQTSYLNNIERRREYGRAYYASHKEYYAAYYKKWSEEHRDEIRERRKRYYRIRKESA